MTPPEFLLASLASCAGYYAAEYLKTRGLPCAGLKVRAGAEKALQPARLDSFHIDVGVPAFPADGDRHRAGVLRAVRSCLVHNTLLSSPRIEVSVTAGPLQAEGEVAGAAGYLTR
jgi:uncharacterized OsmC-like protein